MPQQEDRSLALLMDEWDPEPWITGREPVERHVPEPLPQPVRPALRPRRQPGRDRSILGIAVTHGITAILALGLALIPQLNTPSGWPRALIVLILVLVAGGLVSYDGGLTLFTRGWAANLVASSIVLPVAAVAVALARQPYVALQAGSAGAALKLSLILGCVMLAIAIGFAIWSSDEPDESGLLVLPSVLLIPAMIGIRGEISEPAALFALALSAGVAAFAALMSWSVARPLRAFAPPAALILQVLVLWFSGRGPTVTSTSGQIVPLLFSFLFTIAVLTGVATNGLAVFVHHLERESRPIYERTGEAEQPRTGSSQRPPLR